MSNFLPNTGFKRDGKSPLTPMQHCLDIFHQYITKNFFSTQIAKGGMGKPIVINDKEFKGKQAGDTSRFHFIPQYRGPGIEGQNVDTRGNEKSLDEFYMDMRVELVRQAFIKSGKMTDLRCILDIRQEFFRQLANWFKSKTEQDFADAFSGVLYNGADRYEGSQLMTKNLVNGEGRIAYSKKTGDVFSLEALASNQSNANTLLNLTDLDAMNTTILDYLKDFCLDANKKYPIDPYVSTDGEEYYMLVLHPKAAIALRNDARWEKRALNSFMGNKNIMKDPIATGAMGVWENIIVKEASRVMTQTNGSKTIARNLLYGANAVVLAYAQNLNYVEDDTIDYRNKFGVEASEIRGIRKVVFDDTDLNVAQVVTTI